MKLFVSVFRFPPERHRSPVAVTMMLQAVALLALFTVARDQRPNPRTDPAQWESMGLFVEFMAIASPAMLFIVAAAACFHALDPTMSAAARARACSAMLKLFAIAATLVAAELTYFGLWKGIWWFFGPMTAVVLVNFALVFLVLRYLDVEPLPREQHGSTPPMGPR